MGGERTSARWASNVSIGSACMLSDGFSRVVENGRTPGSDLMFSELGEVTKTRRD